MSSCTHLARASRALIALAVLALAPSCTFDSAGLQGLACEDGASRDDAVCIDGIWVEEEGGGGTDADTPIDGGGTDMGDEPDADVDMGCVETVTEAAACMAEGASCGSVTVDGDCGPVVADCDAAVGPCDADERCEANACICVPETTAEFCARLGNTCGAVTGEDNCGLTRTDVACGTCPVDGSPLLDTCDPDTNVCVCVAETDEAFCGRLGKQCDSVTADDNCENERTVDCGMCDSGACLADNTCEVCQPESDEAFCARLGAECGSLTADDNCMVERTVDCSSAGANAGCTMDEVCDGNTKQCVCPDPVCPMGAQCGQVTNQCGKSTMCGAGCNAANDESCDTNTLTCECDAAVCPVGADCGTFTNACGNSTTCQPNACAGDEVCSSNQCTCQPESDAAFCTRTGTECGSVTAADNCNVSRTVDCGDAATACPADNACTNNQCVCQPESDADFCSRNSAVCDSLTANDNCSVSRTVDCGALTGGCGADEVCDASNACTCPAPTCDPTSCGTLTNACGGSTDCDAVNGGCGMDEVCDATNECVCSTPTCGAGVCGTLTNACGGSADCDAVNGGCGMGEKCEMNACVIDCTPESDLKLCTDNGAECGTINVFDGCSTVDIDCDAARGCSGEVCNGNTCVNDIELNASNRSGNDRFGTSVDVAGDLIVVGAPNEDSGASNAGMVYVYERDPDGSYTQVQQLQSNTRIGGARFGTSVATDGDTIVVGAIEGEFQGVASGAVYVFERSGASWSQVALMGPTNPQSGVDFGAAVDVDGDVIAVGEPFGDHSGSSNSGGLYVFERANGASWSTLDGTAGSPLTYTGVVDDAELGTDVEVDSAIGYVYASAPYDCNGRIAVYSKSGGNWSEFDVVTHDGGSCGQAEELGLSFATRDGVIYGGLHLSDDSGNDHGSVRAFYPPGVWNQDPDIFSSSPSNNAGFGFRVAVSGAQAAFTELRDVDGRGDAPRVFIGTVDTTAPYTNFTTPNAGGEGEGGANDDFGYSLAISDEVVVIGRPGQQSNRGRVHVYPLD